jgi:hypothetical protein
MARAEGAEFPLIAVFKFPAPPLSTLKEPARGWEHVLVLDTSRIARRRLIAMMFEGDCVKFNVRLTYKSLPESDPATDMVLRSVMQAFDEYHSLINVEDTCVPT